MITSCFGRFAALSLSRLIDFASSPSLDFGCDRGVRCFLGHALPLLWFVVPLGSHLLRRFFGDWWSEI
jgi:hypothetical protein